MEAGKHLSAVLVLAFAGLLSCSSTKDAPMEAQITDEIVAEATVVAVDKATRAVTLQEADGSRVIVVCGPEVRNFDRIAAGNKVRARYEVTLSARRLKPDEAETAPSVGVAAGRAGAGEAPAGAVAAGVAMTVTVKSVDKKQHIVAFTDPSGALHAVEAERDEGKRFVAGLKAGDRVELVYTEAVALSVE